MSINNWHSPVWTTVAVARTSYAEKKKSLTELHENLLPSPKPRTFFKMVIGRRPIAFAKSSENDEAHVMY